VRPARWLPSRLSRGAESVGAAPPPAPCRC
jgi:hypothetical protein